MLRVFNLKSVLSTTENFTNNFVNLQSVRWRRKPRWLPVARSKMFRVPPRTITPVEERIELMRLYNNYRTQMKGIRSYLHSEYNVKSIIVDAEEHEKEFAEEFAACSKINEEWNEAIRKEREARHTKELEEERQKVYKKLDEYNQRQKQLLQSVEDIVRKEKESSKDFITPENLDEAIERALANPVDYNFAIDLDGNIYQGTDARPEESKEPVKVTN